MNAYKQLVHALRRWSGLKTDLTADEIGQLPVASASREKTIVELAEETSSSKLLLMTVAVALCGFVFMANGNLLVGMTILAIDGVAMIWFYEVVCRPITLLNEQVNGSKVKR